MNFDELEVALNEAIRRCHRFFNVTLENVSLEDIFSDEKCPNCGLVGDLVIIETNKAILNCRAHGVWEVGIDWPFQELERVLKDTLMRIEREKEHEHIWVHPDEAYESVRCEICGKNGDS